jgi:4-hydroxy-3-polyprenylbenzoate decarboxylase
LVGPVIPKTVPGVKAVHAVDAAGVHPLLLAVGSERYVPYDKEKMPRELLTQASALLGQGQLSLAKYLWIAAAEDDPGLEVDDVAEFLRHMLERVDWRRDLHFHTCTTIDTLDYSGDGLNQGSKVVIAAAGPSRRRLPVALSSEMGWPAELDTRNPRVCLPGIVAVEGPKYASAKDGAVERFAAALPPTHPINSFPLILVVDDSRFAARSLENLLWTVFTKSNPASDVYGIGAFTENKHWGCLGSLVIDARSKPHHAPPLVEDPDISRRVDSLAAVGGPLEGLF